MDALQEIDSLRRQLRRASQRNYRAFDEGFKAAVDMVARGADLDRLQTAYVEYEDTAVCEWDENTIPNHLYSEAE